jgi:hypothetical protein
MATTKAQQKAVNKYIKNNYDVVRATVPKGLKDKITYRAYESGHASVTAYISHLIRDDMGMTAEEWKKAGE